MGRAGKGHVTHTPTLIFFFTIVILPAAGRSRARRRILEPPALLACVYHWGLLV